MRFASVYLGLIGLLSLARAMPMNQQPSLVAGTVRKCIYTVKFLEEAPLTMTNPPSTEVDLVKSVVASVSEDAKTAMKGFLEQHEKDVLVKYENDYPFPQLRKIIYYSATQEILRDDKRIAHWDMYGWVATVKDDTGRYHGVERFHGFDLPSPSIACMTCGGRPHTGLPNI
ncbi:hypothetical protein GGU11DRAFT_380326 [Lentinula aff. detonsa]|nr:hypothetical protein GGU11DRAFT_380326 [Lentinula aff. detonsa]